MRRPALPAVIMTLTLASVVCPMILADPDHGSPVAAPAPRKVPLADRPVSPETAGSIARIAWLSGCWSATTDGGIVEEQWMRPAGGMMLGMSRTVRDGRVMGFEQMRIEEKDGGLVFTAKPSAQPEASFASIDLNASMVTFENRGHDFPQRIIYRHNENGTVAARIEGEMNGRLQGMDFLMSRAGCGKAFARPAP